MLRRGLTPQTAPQAQHPQLLRLLFSTPHQALVDALGPHRHTMTALRVKKTKKNFSKFCITIFTSL